MNGARRAIRLLAALCVAMALPANAGHLSYGWQKVDDLRLFFREGGPSTAPTIVFLHGNPSSSIMYEELMQRLVDAQPIHVLAVDYPSFGYSDAPDHRSYRYTFDNVAATVRKFLRARGITRYGLYMQDYGVVVDPGTAAVEAPTRPLNRHVRSLCLDCGSAASGPNSI